MEEVYVQGLRKLGSRRPQDASNDLGYTFEHHLIFCVYVMLIERQSFSVAMADDTQFHRILSPIACTFCSENGYGCGATAKRISEQK